MFLTKKTNRKAYAHSILCNITTIIKVSTCAFPPSHSVNTQVMMRLVEIIIDGLDSDELRNLSEVIRSPEKSFVTCISMSTIKPFTVLGALQVQKALDFKSQ